jgi:hypothetical protein
LGSVLALHRILAVLCPDSPPARTARDLVFSEGFWTNALYLALPFVFVLIAAVILLRRLDRGSP